jgi:hypothetical protein
VIILDSSFSKLDVSGVPARLEPGREAGVVSGPETERRSGRKPISPNKGGHFAAWEEPEIFSSELREAFRSLR